MDGSLGGFGMWEMLLIFVVVILVVVILLFRGSDNRRQGVLRGMSLLR